MDYNHDNNKNKYVQNTNNKKCISNTEKDSHFPFIDRYRDTFANHVNNHTFTNKTDHDRMLALDK